LKLVSWNVNGIRACVNKGMTDWVKNFAPDILGIQETKAQFDQYPKELMELDYHVLHTSAQKKGYSGVALFSKEKPLSTQEGIGVNEYDQEGRNLIAEFENFYVFNSYYPNGQRDHSRVEFKLGFYDAVLKKANELKKKKPVILMGDFNTAHHEIDLAHVSEILAGELIISLLIKQFNQKSHLPEFLKKLWALIIALFLLK